MKISFTILLSLILGISSAQNFYFEPTDILSKTIVTDNISDLNINIMRNETVDTLHLEYELITNTLPEQWYAGYCDNHGCWGALPESGYMSPMYEDLNSYIKLSINPEGIDGSGIVEYYVYEVGHYEDGILMTFLVDTPGFVGIGDIERNHLNFYPNPFKEQIHINSAILISEVNIYDITGRLVRHENGLNKKEISLNTSDWMSGIYLMEVSSISGQKETRKLTKK